jgi:hypothetical protein
VFDPGLGRIRAGFFYSRYGFNFRATGPKPLNVEALKENRRKNKQREKPPAPGAGLIAAQAPKSRQSGLKTGRNSRIRGQKTLLAQM